MAEAGVPTWMAVAASAVVTFSVTAAIVGTPTVHSLSPEQVCAYYATWWDGGRSMPGNPTARSDDSFNSHRDYEAKKCPQILQAAFDRTDVAGQ